MVRRAVTEDELAADLLRLTVTRLLDPLDILFADEITTTLRGRAEHAAAGWAQQLLGQDRTVAMRLASRLIAVFYPDDAPFDPPPRWWDTPFGRVVASRLGHPGAEHVSYAVAGAMLGITRQGVHDLVRRHKLALHPDGGVASDSISERLGQA